MNNDYDVISKAASWLKDKIIAGAKKSDAVKELAKKYPSLERSSGMNVLMQGANMSSAHANTYFYKYYKADIASPARRYPPGVPIVNHIFVKYDIRLK